MGQLTGWLKGAKGKLDGKVMYQEGGKTIIRNIVTPKNPKTTAQNVQRVITKTVQQQYGALKSICDHSFEGRSYGKECMNRFMQLNNIRLRDRAIEIQDAGGSLETFYNFAPKGSTTYVPARVYVSEGTLNQVRVQMGFPQDATYQIPNVAMAENTYASLIAAYGLRRGDQLTFVAVEWDGYQFVANYARVILDPRDAQGQPLPLSTPFVDENNAVNMPNPRNNGALKLTFEGGSVDFTLASELGTAAAGVIVSRRTGEKWLRSTCLLTLSEVTLQAHPSYMHSLIDAANAEAKGLYFDDGYYLNGAGQSAAGGGSESGADPTAPQIFTVIMNGLRQDAAGGSAEIDFPLFSLSVEGVNIENVQDEENPRILELFSRTEEGNWGPEGSFGNANDGIVRSYSIDEGGISNNPLAIAWADGDEHMIGEPLFIINASGQPPIVNP